MSISNQGNKVIVRIWRFIIEIGWYKRMPPVVIGIRVMELFPDIAEVVIACVQIERAVLCVSWDYGR